MNKVTTVCLLLLICALPGIASSNECLYVRLAGASEALHDQLAEQLQNEPNIQLAISDEHTSQKCRTVTIRLHEDAALFYWEQESDSSIIVDLSAVPEEHWARTLALTCATLFVPGETSVFGKQTDVANNNNGAAKTDRSPSADAKSHLTEKSLLLQPFRISITVSKKQFKKMPHSRPWGIGVRAGVRWMPSFEVAGPQYQLDGVYSGRKWMPIVSLLGTYHRATTRSGHLFLATFGAAASLLRTIFTTPTSRTRFFVGPSLEWLLASAKGEDDSYMNHTDVISQVVSAAIYWMWIQQLSPRLSLLVSGSTGVALKSLVLQVGDTRMLGMQKFIGVVGLGVMFGGR